HARADRARAAAGRLQPAHRRLPPRRHDLEGESRAARAAVLHVSARRSRSIRQHHAPCAQPAPDPLRSPPPPFPHLPARPPPDFPAIEWYIHTTVDPSLRDPDGHHNSALFVQWVPYTLAGTSWEAEEEPYVRHLLSICDQFAPGTSDLVADTFALTPPKIERH